MTEATLAQPVLSQCCGTALRRYGSGGRLSISVCAECDSLWAQSHLPGESVRPWADLAPTQAFVEALRRRRKRQATQILNAFPELRLMSILDYGAGQGVFVETLVQLGVDAVGCDIDVSASRAGVPLYTLSRPWEMPPPGRGVTTMLDVLEHHPTPAAFLGCLSSEYLLLKVPLATGPITRLARASARAGRWTLLDALFLADDPSPHVVLFSRVGLVRLAASAGWDLVRCASLPEVGVELPDRVRVPVGQASPLRRTAVRVVGALLEQLAWWWSDTQVCLFRRSRPGCRGASPEFIASRSCDNIMKP